jgi:excisionase family DNA binding protein
MEGRRLLSAEEVAAKIRMEVPYVWKLAREGRIPHLRFRRTLRFREESIAAWLEERERGNGARATKAGGSVRVGHVRLLAR